MLYLPRSSDDHTYRQILAMVSSDDAATRLRGARLLFGTSSNHYSYLPKVLRDVARRNR